MTSGKVLLVKKILKEGRKEVLNLDLKLGTFS